MSMIFRAMEFARNAHRSQRRKYTNAPYFDHLAEVAGIVASVCDWEAFPDGEMVAVAWLHDCIEDQGVTTQQICDEFTWHVARGVWLLSDIEGGNRETRKRLSRYRLAGAPGWVQTIKCADVISNTSSIVQFDPKFARVYLEENHRLLKVMAKADRRLWDIANQLVVEAA